MVCRAELLTPGLRPVDPAFESWWVRPGGATRVDKIMGCVHWEGFFREASGPGWALSTASSALACSGVTPGLMRSQMLTPMPARE